MSGISLFIILLFYRTSRVSLLIMQAEVHTDSR